MRIKLLPFLLSIFFLASPAFADRAVLQNGSGVEVGTSTNPLGIRVSGGSTLVTSSTGYVGIGTSSPLYQLHLNGDLYMTSPDGLTGFWGNSIDMYNGGDGAVIIRDSGTNAMLGVRSSAGDTAYISHDGTNAVIGTDTGMVSFPDLIRFSVSSTTISDNGAGTCASSTITPTTSLKPVTCNDSNCCNLTMSETGAQNGGLLFIHNISSNPVYIPTSSGVFYAPRTVRLNNAGDTATLQYENNQWTLVSSRESNPTAQTIAAGDTILDDACGGMKQITAAGAVTTSTTNTFTAPASSNRSCNMDVCNVGANTITLDNNANFKSFGGLDVSLTADDCVSVGSNGASGAWYQLAPVSVN